MGALTRRVKDLPVPEFVCLLDFITAEFQQYLRAIELIEHESLETLLEELLDAFTLKIAQILQADRATIFLLDEEKEQLWSRTSRNSAHQEIRLPLQAGIIGHVAQSGEALNVADAPNHPLFDRDVDEFADCPARNLLCMPIFSSKKGDKVVAIVQLLNKAGDRPFDGEDELEFRAFADSIGIILESCQSFYMAARNQRGLSALLEAAATLGQSLDLETTLRSVMDRARDLMQADRSTLFLLSRDTDELWTKVAKADGTTMMEIRIPASKGIVGYVAATGQTLNIANAYHDPRFDPSTDERTGYQTRNLLCMPVYDRAGQLMGVTQIVNKNQGSFNKSDEEFLRAFNAQSGIALENAQLFEKNLLEKQYQKDILQSLSDAVISTDFQGKVVTINEAALALLGCPGAQEGERQQVRDWEQKCVGRFVWDIVPLETLRSRLEDSLTTGARHYVPEQNLYASLYREGESWILLMPDRVRSDRYFPWGDVTANPVEAGGDRLRQLERSVNLTVNPLSNPEGGVRGGLVVLEDISREKRMKTTMYRYMTPGVAERVMDLGDDTMMVGERKEVTILFSDIRGYTTLTEDLGAAEVVSLLNEYFETMVEAVFDFEGTLDKFIGDALMAVFGAPLPLTENHALMAVRSALDMRRRLAEFNQRRIFANQPRIRIGIGLSSGEVVSGNIGSKKRMDYTVIGDGVNLSSRLESATKEYGCDIILSEYTYRLCPNEFWVRELDRVRVKGKTQSASIYELLGDRNTPPDGDAKNFLDLYDRARGVYLSRDFAKAISLFETLKEMAPGDRAVALHLQRSRQYWQAPPPEDWDGTYAMTTK